MRQLVELDAWKIKQNELGTDQRAYESIFSIGNGSFGQRANFEEKYSDKSLLGNYTGGIYYPDPTKVGWWKNGYPDYFAKVLNSCNWIRLDIEIGLLLRFIDAKSSIVLQRTRYEVWYSK